VIDNPMAIARIPADLAATAASAIIGFRHT